jgi:GNAT superfamily N-acetyltransferase
MSTFVVVPSPPAEILPLRERYRQEMNCQIVHDSIHRRVGWTETYRLRVDGATAGFGSKAIGGPWRAKPTVFEFYVVPEQRGNAFALFDALLAASGARFIETQTNGPLLAIMLHAYSRDAVSEKIIFADAVTMALPSGGATLRRVSTPDEDRQCFDRRDGSSDWTLELEGAPIGKGGIAFHYNRPYGDVYMEIAEPFRRRGFGAYFVQELKRVCRELGGIPAARCDPTNVASRQTCQKAGLVPCGHLIRGTIADR